MLCVKRIATESLKHFEYWSPKIVLYVFQKQISKDIIKWDFALQIKQNQSESCENK